MSPTIEMLVYVRGISFRHPERSETFLSQKIHHFGHIRVISGPEWASLERPDTFLNIIGTFFARPLEVPINSFWFWTSMHVYWTLVGRSSLIWIKTLVKLGFILDVQKTFKKHVFWCCRFHLKRTSRKRKKERFLNVFWTCLAHGEAFGIEF